MSRRRDRSSFTVDETGWLCNRVAFAAFLDTRIGSRTRLPGKCENRAVGIDLPDFKSQGVTSPGLVLERMSGPRL